MIDNVIEGDRVNVNVRLIMAIIAMTITIMTS